MESDKIQLKEIKPVLTGYISKSRVLLKRNAVPDDDAVHDIRVLMKKSRAAMKLVVPAIENDLYEKDIQSLKRVGQIMSGWRDTSVHRKTLKELKKEFPVIFSEVEGIEKILVLMKKPEVRSVPDESIRNGIEEIDELLNKTSYRIRFHQLHNLNAVTLLNQLESSYNAVSVIYIECRNRVNPEKIHEFRKRSKDFLYQLFFFRPLNPSVVRSVEKKLEKLTLSLGRYNDLYQLIKTIGYTYSPESGNPSMDKLIIKIREDQDLALSQAWPLAYKCFSPGTKLADLLKLRLILLSNNQGQQ